MSLSTTASQTIGPYLHIGLAWLVTEHLAGPGVTGLQVTVEGRVIDGDGKPIDDAIMEIWQANAHGRYAHPEDASDLPLEPNFKGFGRVPTDENGGFRFTTIKPGRVPAPGGGAQAPHLNVTIFTRGLLKHVITRMYFPGDPANAGDAVLLRVPAERRDTLVAKPVGGLPGTLAWNVILQGTGETVFFDY